MNTDQIETEAVVPMSPEAVVPMSPEPEPEPESPNREAAKWRRQLRDVEAERDGLRAALTAARREVLVQHPAASRIAESAMDEVFTDPAVDTLFAESGEVNVEAVQAHVAAALEARPHVARRVPRIDVPSEGNMPEVRVGDRWVGAFSPGQR